MQWEGRLQPAAIIARVQNPFSRGRQPLQAPEDQQRWVLGQWIDGELVNTHRWRTGIRVPDPAHPILVKVSLGYASQRSDGLPSPTKLDEFEEIESTVIRELGVFDTYLTMVLTGYSSREFIAYGSQHEFLEEWGPTIIERWSDGPAGATGVTAMSEPKWTTYRQYSK